ncbi:efflux RND transporter periplasmic adaptor subunit [Psychrosphaera aestuarii]|uniref:efflux RND transporter periplasmic adaptor subunit n=1 Tax=Psychrosphaera aestuarii TaxID=1266052 RepID=UPI001B341241|nr:efflux RND transporter periplasmic adaptor subunit [Psychrosphaera aestuarii]
MSTSNSKPGLLERKPYILAIAITVLLIVWMASGMISNDKKVLSNDDRNETEKLPTVEVTVFNTEPVQRSIELYGRTEPDRVLVLDSEVDGRVVEILVEEGQLVKAGQAILKLSLDDKLEQLNFAKSLVEQREIEYKGAISLQAKGLQGESLLAQAKAGLTEAKALVKLRESQLEKSTIVAPFSGVINNQSVEIGSVVSKGQALFELVDLSPLVVTAHVTENYVDLIDENAQVEVLLVNGKRVPGSLRYISSMSEVGTNTFEIEIEIDNPDQKMKAGISTEIDVMFSQEQAIKVSPALLSLDKDGNLGVKTVVNERVVFTPIDMIKTEQDGVWLAGFSGETQVITRGQGFVRPGDQVAVTITQAGN